MRRCFELQNRNQAGSVIPMVLIFAGIVAIAAMAIPEYFKRIDLENKKAQTKLTLRNIKQSLIAALDNDAVWVKVLSDPQNATQMACLKNPGATCNPPALNSIVVREADGQAYIGVAANEGIDLEGKYCTQFDEVNGHETCVFQIRIGWKCNGICQPTVIDPNFLVPPIPKIAVYSTIKYAPKGYAKDRNVFLNTQSNLYTINFERGSQSKTLSSHCASLNGTFNKSTLVCDAPGTTPSSFDCTKMPGQPPTPHRWLRGFDAEGTPICVDDIKLNVACEPGSGVIGIWEDGSWQCGTY